MHSHRRERHRTGRLSWLRAAVLGANDGILSTASLLLGVAAAHATRDSLVVAGIAGLVAGAASMAAGEYVSVSSQADSEAADLRKERHELATDAAGEHAELAAIYVARGLSAPLAEQVATQLAAKDALAAHALDELGISDRGRARPMQAALASAISFACGAGLPVLVAVLAPMGFMIAAIGLLSLAALALLGAIAAQVGGARVIVGVMRVMVLGVLAMALTLGIGAIVGRFDP
ncbi:MAG TPA: VIT family protein [Steroidobacteraceae bacterium]|jgi:VIT1/CCC1 family predicted Fe2+/Mn2+ transporter|nr:VIT family protein [Steroidobacteraceae bacterium]